MSEKRFVLDKLYYTIMTPIEKISVGKSYMTYGEVVNLLNEQQSIIHRDEISIKTMMSNMKKLEEENEQLRKELNDCEKFRYTVFKRMGELHQ